MTREPDTPISLYASEGELVGRSVAKAARPELSLIEFAKRCTRVRCGMLAWMLEAAVYSLLIVFPLIGVLARRWPVVVLPLAGWPIFYIGLTKGWWLDGTGDGWQINALFFTLFGTASTAAAVGLARALKPPKMHALRFAKSS